ncbi:MAG: hypothetical protein AAGJ08_04205 [Cyanobacteria bacterium P01_H01_bin.35]
MTDFYGVDYYNVYVSTPDTPSIYMGWYQSTTAKEPPVVGEKFYSWAGASDSRKKVELEVVEVVATHPQCRLALCQVISDSVSYS